MPGFLKQATAAQARAIGPFVDDTDFKTAETALTIANTDIKLVVNGGASANKNSGGGTHRVNGVYGVTFDATDTATVGEMEVSVVVAGALPVFDKFFVVEEAVYDALFAASAPGYLQPATAGRTLVVDAAGLADANTVKVGPSGSGTAQSAGDLKALIDAVDNFVDTEIADIQARLPAALTGDGLMKVDTLRVGGTLQTAGDVPALITAVDDFVDTEVAAIKAKTDQLTFTDAGLVDSNALRISRSATAADNLEAGALGLVSSTCAVGSTTTSIVTNLTEATDDHYNGRVITFTSGALAGQTSSISDYVGATKTLTVVALTEAPANTDGFVIS